MTMETSIKMALKNRLHPCKLFCNYPIKSLSYLKEGNFSIYVGTEERGMPQSSERDGRSYHLSVLILKRTN